MALLASVVLVGTRAAQPVATAVADGALYAVSDESYLIERSNGTAWSQWGPTPSGTSGGDYEVLNKHSIAVVGGILAGATYGPVGIGDDGLTTAGTLSRVVTASNVFCNFATAAAASAQAYARSGSFTQFQRRHDPDLRVQVIAPSTLTNVRLWIGLTSAAFTDVDTHAGHTAAFRFSSVAGDTGWRPITRDGATQNVGTNIGTVVADTAYLLRIRCVLAGTPTVYFSVDGGTEQAVTANLPTSTQDLGWQWDVIAQAASARNISVSRMLLKWGTTVP